MAFPINLPLLLKPISCEAQSFSNPIQFPNLRHNRLILQNYALTLNYTELDFLFKIYTQEFNSQISTHPI